MCIHTLLVPFFLVGSFVFGTCRKREHRNPKGNGDIFPERAVQTTGPAAQGMELGRTRESALVGGRGSTRGCHHPPGDKSSSLLRMEVTV